MTVDGYSTDLLKNLTVAFSTNQKAAYNWLNNLPDWLNSNDNVTYEVACMVGAILIYIKEEYIVQKALDTFVEICKKSSTQVRLHKLQH